MNQPLHDTDPFEINMRELLRRHARPEEVLRPSSASTPAKEDNRVVLLLFALAAVALLAVLAMNRNNERETDSPIVDRPRLAADDSDTTGVDPAVVTFPEGLLLLRAGESRIVSIGDEMGNYTDWQYPDLTGYTLADVREDSLLLKRNGAWYLLRYDRPSQFAQYSPKPGETFSAAAMRHRQADTSSLTQKLPALQYSDTPGLSIFQDLEQWTDVRFHLPEDDRLAKHSFNLTLKQGLTAEQYLRILSQLGPKKIMITRSPLLEEEDADPADLWVTCEDGSMQDAWKGFALALKPLLQGFAVSREEEGAARQMLDDMLADAEARGLEHDQGWESRIRCYQSLADIAMRVGNLETDPWFTNAPYETLIANLDQMPAPAAQWKGMSINDAASLICDAFAVNIICAESVCRPVAKIQNGSVAATGTGLLRDLCNDLNATFYYRGGALIVTADDDASIQDLDTYPVFAADLAPGDRHAPVALEAARLLMADDIFRRRAAAQGKDAESIGASCFLRIGNSLLFVPTFNLYGLHNRINSILYQYRTNGFDRAMEWISQRQSPVVLLLK